MRKLLVLAVLFAVGCGQYNIGNVVNPVVSEAYSELEQDKWVDVVSQASDIWRVALEGCSDPFPMIGDGPALPITLRTPEGWDSPGAVGYTRTFDHIEVMGPTPGNELDNSLITIVVHEMGHILGIDHTDRLTSIMRPGLFGNVVPDKTDIEYAKKFLGCL